LPFAIVPIRNVDINFLRHLADTSESIQDYVPRVGCQFGHRRPWYRSRMSKTRSC